MKTKQASRSALPQRRQLPGSESADPAGAVDALQRSSGNHAVQQLFAPVKRGAVRPARSLAVLGENAFEVKTGQAMFFIGGRPVALDDEGVPQEADEEQGPYRYIVTRAVANCVVFAQRGTSRIDSAEVVHFAHLSSKQYEPRAEGPDQFTRATIDFRGQYDDAESVMGTNEERGEASYNSRSMRLSNLPTERFHTAGGNLAHMPFVLDLEDFTLYPASEDGHPNAFEYWGQGITDYPLIVPSAKGRKKIKAPGGCIIT
jgi:hypothetical protein